MREKQRIEDGLAAEKAAARAAQEAGAALGEGDPITDTDACCAGDGCAISPEVRVLAASWALVGKWQVSGRAEESHGSGLPFCSWQQSPCAVAMPPLHSSTCLPPC